MESVSVVHCMVGGAAFVGADSGEPGLSSSVAAHGTVEPVGRWTPMDKPHGPSPKVENQDH
jgi:hypothetical protein